MLKTLLQVGDKIRIRKDINGKTRYNMKTFNHSNFYVENRMATPGRLVTIESVTEYGYHIIEEDFFTYTDEMFELDIIDYLYEEYMNNK